ncbi:MAG: hypothetical protein JXR05_07145 [Flavobacteriaceae bacterium]
MKKLEGNTNKNSDNFLKEKVGVSSSEHHKEYLGMGVPENYFSNSKATILDLVSEKKIVPVFYLRRSFQVAASLTLLVCLSIAIRFSTTNTPDDLFIASDDVLIESLFVDDANVSEFMNDVLVSEIVVEAEVSEQNLENILMNSLFIEDSLIDGYAKKSLLDNIIL